MRKNVVSKLTKSSEIEEQLAKRCVRVGGVVCEKGHQSERGSRRTKSSDLVGQYAKKFRDRAAVCEKKSSEIEGQ